MGSMSASDAAPLPRLGEVFFDVRGSSRSMRLSWYADTGVAVFSIWQGGMCTGTFRLAIDDLPRMVETLQRGPGGQSPGRDPAPPTQAFGDARMDATVQGRGLEPLPGEELPDYQPAVPGYGPGPADPLNHAGPPGYDDALYPGGRPGASYPGGRPGASYPGPRPGASYPGPRSGASYPGRRSDTPYPGARPEASYPGSRPEAPHPGPRSGAPYPGPLPEAPYPGDVSYSGASTGGPHSRGTAGRGGHPGGLADDPYLGGTGPMDFPAEPPPAHYPPGTSAPGYDGTPGPSADDYPAHYGAAVSDDVAPSPPPESFPYGRPPGNRGATGRHADPEAPLD